MDISAFEQFNNVDLLLPFFKDLLHNPDTATLSAWYLFDPIAKSLGVQDTIDQLLDPILKLYEQHDWEEEKNLSSVYRTKKSVKLYHHSFLLKLIVRFGLKCFLDNFSTRLIEAVGGCRDIEQEEYTSKHIHRKSSVKKTLRPMESINKTVEKYIDEQDLFTFDEDKHQKFIQDSESESVLDLRLNHSQAEEATEENDNGADFLDDKFKQEHFGDFKNLHEELSEERANNVNDITLIITESISEAIADEKKIDNEKLKSEETESGFKRTRSRKSRSSGSNRNSRISDMSSDSLIWLAHRYVHNDYFIICRTWLISLLTFRLGPVLTARYLTRNLLKMLSLCYLGEESLVQKSHDLDSTPKDISCCRHDVSHDKKCLCDKADIEIAGDEYAQRVMDCLLSIAGL